MSKESGTHPYYETRRGRIYCVDSLEFMRSEVGDASVDLIVTSPPFGLVRKKTYGNVDAANYVRWFHPFGLEFHRAARIRSMTEPPLGKDGFIWEVQQDNWDA